MIACRYSRSVMGNISFKLTHPNVGHHQQVEAFGFKRSCYDYSFVPCHFIPRSTCYAILNAHIKLVGVSSNRATNPGTLASRRSSNKDASDNGSIVWILREKSKVFGDAGDINRIDRMDMIPYSKSWNAWFRRLHYYKTTACCHEKEALRTSLALDFSCSRYFQSWAGLHLVSWWFI